MKNAKEIDIIVYEPVKRDKSEEKNEFEEIKQNKKYCGLYNRGNTCYLNSLLQTLFMTPEFRLNILTWKFNENIHGKREDCIPFQLQKLFARMQLKCRESEMTEDLTKSFQWGYQQLVEQHDIQELCRVLFEAIENSLFEHEDNFIKNIYQGSSISVVKCLECNNESEKKDNFMDISLPVRNEFEKIYNTSLEMAFFNFLKKEKLEGDNQYRCELCNRKVDALKFIKFMKLPKILFLQLNRFEYDILTDGRRKICDRVTFPMILNMNTFLKDSDLVNKEFTKEKLNLLEQREDFEFTEAKIDDYKKEGEYVYELYAVVVHSGCARGGHYYSYIKSFEDNKWYRFDDSSVFDADFKKIQLTFGETTRTGLNAVTGYILMYRQIDITNMKDSNTIGNIIIQDNKELMDLIDKENIQLIEEELRQKEKLNTLQIKFIYNDKIANIIAKKNETVFDLKIKVLKEYGLDEQTKLENMRIRSINTQTLKLLHAFSDESKTLEDACILSTKTYSFEIKQHDEEFEDYNPDIIIINICKWIDTYNMTTEEKDFKYDKIKIDKNFLMLNLKKLIFSHYNITAESDIFVIKKVDIGINNNQITPLFENEEELNKQINLFVPDNSKLFLEIKSASWEESNFIKYFDENSANVTVNFNFPVKLETIVEPTTSTRSKIKSTPRMRVGLYKFDNQIEIKKNKTLGELKKRISDVLNIREDEFIMKKKSHNGVELKNLSELIDKHTISNIDIYIEYGNPQKDSEIKISVYRTEYDFSFFLVFPYKTVDEGIFKAELNWTIQDLKKHIVNELEKKSVLSFSGINLNEIFIREYKNDRPTKFYSNGSILGKDLQFTENKKIIIQRYKETDISNDNFNDVQVSIRMWDPSQWKISAPFEIHFHKGTTFLELAEKLNKLFDNIDPHNMSVYKIVNDINVYMDDFKKYKFENLYEKNDFILDHYPLFINTDGCMLILKDDTKVYRDPTEEESRILCRPKLLSSKGKKSVSSTSSLTSNSSTNSRTTAIKTSFNGFKKEKEKGVVIKVKKNEIGKINEVNEQSPCDPFKNGKHTQEEEKSGVINNKNQKIEIEIYSKDINGINSNNIKPNLNKDEAVDYAEYDEIIKG